MNFILLAAGQGQRMGGNKALMLVNEKPWILTQIQEIRSAGIEDITVVTNAESQTTLESVLADLSPKVTIVTNSHPELGPFSSLQLALMTTPIKTCFLSPVDVPLKADTIKKLHQAWLQWGPIQALIPLYNKRGGHPVMLSSDLQKSLLKFAPDHPESRLDFVLKSLSERDKRALDLEDPSVIMNLNTPENLATLSR